MAKHPPRTRAQIDGIPTVEWLEAVLLGIGFHEVAPDTGDNRLKVTSVRYVRKYTYGNGSDPITIKVDRSHVWNQGWLIITSRDMERIARLVEGKR